MFSRTLPFIARNNFCRLLSTLTKVEPQPSVKGKPMLLLKIVLFIIQIINNFFSNYFLDPPKELIRNPLDYPDYFHVHNIFTIRDLFDARVHYGHKEGSLNDKMKPFLFGSRLGHTIFDLDITAFHLREALNFLAHVAYNDGIILFVSRNPEITLHVENTAKEVKEFAYTRQWKLGLFTDSTKVFRNVTRLPDVCIFLNTLEETGIQHQGVIDAAKLNIPSIGIVDSNCDPNIVTYPVPGNDDSYESLKLYCKIFKEAILRGKKERQIVFGESNLDTKENDYKSEKED